MAAERMLFCFDENPEAEKWASYADGLPEFFAPLQWRIPEADEIMCRVTG